MNKTLIIVIVCCVLPLVIISFLLWYGNYQNTLSNQPTEKTDSMSSVGVLIGATSPDFQLTDISGKNFRKSDLLGKPVILWFTASYCIPCQIGAKEVKRLDDDMGVGGNTFDVVMIFIDPRETVDDLRWWKENFGNPDWYIAFGNEQIIADYKIRYLDTQYLLDKSGVIKNVANSNVGYERYKNLIQPLLQ